MTIDEERVGASLGARELWVDYRNWDSDTSSCRVMSFEMAEARNSAKAWRKGPNPAEDRGGGGGGLGGGGLTFMN